ncbi:sulfite exporter TauE/SafE family protein [Lysinibacter sp. HNR]|uniref:sulfite exporter TauE/SafE family protein n=1 Tax=Lysinibacter sp. HNR TaxID=3031408 RepID=UPI0024352073|nr:sulfite exporter TauE/SafE family protein [Lysinibacter sp. HNR]WGD37134.1 sulfite exporter TauE/SafE family protein [Lysinibacter sp. HNR]
MTNTPDDSRVYPRGWYVKLILLGLFCGLLTGLFGVGGGVVLVPALVLIMRFDQRTAAGTSLAAIVPTVIVSLIGYAASGNVDVLAALILAAGMIAGTQIGTYYMARVRHDVLQWMFIAFLVFVIVQMFINVPSRAGMIEFTGVSISGLIVLGLATGLLSGLLGVGGGVVVVPMLIVFFGASDLIAKGTSLLMMIPGALSGTAANIKRKNIHVRAAIVLGLSASSITWLGAILATMLTPLASNLLFASFLVIITVRMALHALRRRG